MPDINPVDELNELITDILDRDVTELAVTPAIPPLPDHIQGDQRRRREMYPNVIWQANIPMKAALVPEFKPEYCRQARRLCLASGGSDKQLATFFEVAPRTIARWRAMFPEFAEAIQSGRDVADGEVAETLHDLATGRVSVMRKKAFADVRTGNQLVVEYEEQLPPSVPAAVKWLQARQPDTWRHAKPMTPSDLENLTDEELAELAAGQQLPSP